MSRAKNRGMFRRIVDTAKRSLGMRVTHHYADPVLRQPQERKKKRAHGHIQKLRRLDTSFFKKQALRIPPCELGTITYHDKLVRHFGRRKAEFYGRFIQSNQLSLLPTEQDFADALPEWSFLK